MLTIAMWLIIARLSWTVILVPIAAYWAQKETENGWGSIALFAIGLFPELALLGLLEKLVAKIRSH